jgi:hypothetical protein
MLSVAWAVAGMVVLAIVLMIATKLYKKFRKD